MEVSIAKSVSDKSTRFRSFICQISLQEKYTFQKLHLLNHFTREVPISEEYFPNQLQKEVLISEASFAKSVDKRSAHFRSFICRIGW